MLPGVLAGGTARTAGLIATEHRDAMQRWALRLQTAITPQAKEAVWKALGEGPRLGVAWRELAVGNEPSGKPRLTLSGVAAKRLSDLTPAGMEPRIDLSLSDEPPLAQAFVVISAEPPSHSALRLE